MTYKILLGRVAAQLHIRGAVDLAADVIATATEFPEADELPPGPVQTDDAFMKTSDWGEELGVPPYDQERPKVEGDEPED